MNQLPQRKLIRLKHYDYSQSGYYFVTICTKNRETLFGNAVGADDIRPQEKNYINLSHYGEIVNMAIQAIPRYYPNVKIDEYVIMPNHLHLILIISNEDNNGRMISAPTKPLATIIGQMKRWVSRKIGFSIWQKSYYEHIIRSEADYIKALEYILNNPFKEELKP